MMRDGGRFIRKTGDSSILSDSRLSNYKAGKANRKAEQGYRRLLECIARILRFRKCDKTARFSVLSIQMGRLPQNKRCVFFPYSVFGRCALGAVYFCNKRRQRERGLIRTDAFVLIERSGEGSRGVIRIVPKRSRHDTEYRWPNVNSPYIGDDVSAKGRSRTAFLATFMRRFAF